MRGWSMATAALALCSASAVQATNGPRCVPVPREKIAAQLYVMAQPMLSTRAGGPPAAGRRIGLAVEPGRLAAALARLKGAGFDRVEAFGGGLGLTPVDYAGAFRAAGVRVIGSHEELDLAGWEAALDRARRAGQLFVGSATFGAPGFGTLGDTLRTAANLDRLGRAAAAKGLAFYVHNHAGEFATRYPYDADRDGKAEMLSVWEIVAAATDPRHVRFEVDVHWARRGLGLERSDALLDLLRRHRDRIALLHVKDTAADGGIADLGRGTTDWRRVFDAAGAGVAWYV